MKHLRFCNLSIHFLILLAAVLFLAGCATTRQVDWNSRVGFYTYDQAIVEFGPPDKQATLSDGRTVAEWISRRLGSSGGRSGTVTAAHRLRLSFGTDGRLADWARN